jgi:hypothetical protein
MGLLEWNGNGLTGTLKERDWVIGLELAVEGLDEEEVSLNFQTTHTHTYLLIRIRIRGLLPHEPPNTNNKLRSFGFV